MKTPVRWGLSSGGSFRKLGKLEISIIFEPQDRSLQIKSFMKARKDLYSLINLHCHHIFENSLTSVYSLIGTK